ncbi:hypothetical protein ACFW04_012423 [Cataglyphis niger]
MLSAKDVSVKNSYLCAVIYIWRRKDFSSSSARKSTLKNVVLKGILARAVVYNTNTPDSVFCRLLFRDYNILIIEWNKRNVNYLRADSESNAHDVTLMNVSRLLTGTYKCEVSAGSPSYHTFDSEGQYGSSQRPKNGSYDSYEKERIAVGETLRVNCSSGESRPAPVVTWKLNGEPIAEDNMQYKIQHYNISFDNELQSMKSLIQFKVTENMFLRSGRLHLRCTASISDVYRKSADIEITEDKPRLAPITGVKSPSYGEYFIYLLFIFLLKYLYIYYLSIRITEPTIQEMNLIATIMLTHTCEIRA